MAQAAPLLSAKALGPMVLPEASSAGFEAATLFDHQAGGLALHLDMHGLTGGLDPWDSLG